MDISVLMTDYGRHYETAFQSYLENINVAYVPLSQVKKASLDGEKLKSFDYIIHRDIGKALLADIKGRKHTLKEYNNGKPGQNWVTIDDVYSMQKWQESFGCDYDSLFVFAYWITDCNGDSASGLFCYDDRYYWFIGMYVNDYQVFMKKRSRKWGTVDLPAGKFRNLCQPLGRILER